MRIATLTLMFALWTSLLTPQTRIYLPKITHNQQFKAGEIVCVDPIVGNLRFVPAGTFLQGSPDTELGRFSDEGPQFWHTLTKNMAVMETEVTRQMWADLCAVLSSIPKDPSYFTSQNTLPVEKVSWYETVLFSNLLSEQSRIQRVYYTDGSFSMPITSVNYQTDRVYVNWNANGYRLPTEGEWEYFARAGTTGPFSIAEPAYNESTIGRCSAGSLPALESVAWFCSNSVGTSHVAGTKVSNQWGLKDVDGNVREWVWDWWNYRKTGQSLTDYRGPSNGEVRLLKGGSWGDTPNTGRLANRGGLAPSHRGSNLGFRLLRPVN